MIYSMFKAAIRRPILSLISLILIASTAAPAFGAEVTGAYGKDEVFLFAGDEFLFKEIVPLGEYSTDDKDGYGLVLQKKTDWYSASFATNADDPNDTEVIFVYTVENSVNPIRAMNITLEDNSLSIKCTGVIIAELPNKKDVTFVFQINKNQALPGMAYITGEAIGGTDKNSIGIILQEGGGENPASQPAPANAAPSSSSVLVNGENVSFDAYRIDDSNYFKLRDIAFAVNGTEKQFEISWDEANNAIALISTTAYTIAGGELEPGTAGDKQATATSSAIMVDGGDVSLTAYNIDGSNYFKLRDIGKIFNFNIGWDGELNVITIDTSLPYSE